ncbi:DoxX family protein [Leucobacter sp. PH1c]|uniref:DoxX family protein n=1 Tax=Leucobacter sp. PH1c TaxID=1397278 RepID=UPI0004691347|nr:DoxX family protein [Leucobacter sp. PH1c]
MTTSTLLPDTRTAWGLLLLRVVAGGIFAAHGLQKLLEFTLAGTTASFEAMGVPAAVIVAPAVALLETFGGVLLVIGGFTRTVGLLLALDMVGALVLVHASAGLWVDGGGFEFVAVLGAAALALALTGPGRISIDALLSKRTARIREARPAR